MTRPREASTAESKSCTSPVGRGNWVLIGVGVILLLLLCAFFGGYGFWTFPGWLVVLAGIAGVINAAYARLDRGRPRLMRWGTAMLLIGIACYLSFSPHVMLGVLHGVSWFLIGAGLIVTVVGYSRS